MECNHKQAYLIIAHKDDFTFRTLLKMLDNEKNDLFIHMDKKNKSYNADEIRGLVSKSNLYHTPRTSVTWGGYSQINAEYLLLKLAVEKGSYHHLHLISGEDLPIQTQENIQKFFEIHSGKEFVGFDTSNFEFGERVYYRWFLRENIGRYSPLKAVRKLLLLFQMKFGITRNKNVHFQKGENWFSITDSLARYVVSQEEWVKSVFADTFCADEIFLQTLVVNSPFKEKLYRSEFDGSCQSTQRCVDWQRGTPYTWRIEDINERLDSPLMFARKFDCAVDDKIISEIERAYSA